MKKLIASLVLMLTSTISYAESYKCTGYIDGKPVGEPAQVTASKVAVAESKAYSRLKKSGITVDYVHCK